MYVRQLRAHECMSLHLPPNMDKAGQLRIPHRLPVVQTCGLLSVCQHAIFLLYFIHFVCLYYIPLPLLHEQGTSQYDRRCQNCPN